MSDGVQRDRARELSGWPSLRPWSDGWYGSPQQAAWLQAELDAGRFPPADCWHGLNQPVFIDGRDATPVVAQPQTAPPRRAKPQLDVRLVAFVSGLLAGGAVGFTIAVLVQR